MIIIVRKIVHLAIYLLIRTPLYTSKFLIFNFSISYRNLLEIMLPEIYSFKIIKINPLEVKAIIYRPSRSPEVGPLNF